MVAQSVPNIPQAVSWRNGMVLDPSHFQSTDQRTAQLTHLASLLADPWPWGFAHLEIDDTALASGQLRVDCEGIFPDGVPFVSTRLNQPLPEGSDGDQADYSVRRTATGELLLQAGDHAPGNDMLPVAKLVFRGGLWSGLSDWSAPTLLVGQDHAMRTEVNRQLGALAALCTGFMATLRLPGAENRPAARMLGLVAGVLAQGVGVIEALLAAPAVAPGRIGLEALRLALGVRSAAGIFEQLDSGWDPADQRGSIRRLLYAAESAASGIGLPFRASVFKASDDDRVLLVDGVPSGGLLLAIEASRPADLIAARAWFDGSALAAPDRIQEALTRRVSGCRRHAVARDPSIGVSSGPLIALYQVDDDLAWRGGQQQLALAADTPPPANTSFSIFIVEGAGGGAPPLLEGSQRDTPDRPPRWASGTAVS